LEGSYKFVWSKVPYVEPPRTLDDVRKLVTRPFSAEETSTPSEKSEGSGIGRLIVGSGESKNVHSDDSNRGNLLYSPLPYIPCLCWLWVVVVCVFVGG